MPQPKIRVFWDLGMYLIRLEPSEPTTLWIYRDMSAAYITCLALGDIERRQAIYWPLRDSYEYQGVLG